MSTSTSKAKIPCFKVTFFDKHINKIEYTFAKLQEAILFQVGMQKKGYDTNLTRELI
jgi:hypothetical protein